MYRKQSVLNYLSKGFSLANHSLDIYLISVSLLLINSLSLHNLPSPFGIILSILTTFILFFVYFGFNLSIPLFIQEKEKEKALNYHKVYKTVIENTKRIILPAILFLTLFFVAAVALLSTYYLIANSQGTSDKQISSSIVEQLIGLLIGWNPVAIAFSLVSSIIFSFLTFTSIFFSIEDKGIFRSIAQSVVLSSKHLHYISIIILVNLITSLIFKLFPIEQTWGRMLISALSQYVNLIITASSLLYYRAVEFTLHTPGVI